MHANQSIKNNLAARRLFPLTLPLSALILCLLLLVTGSTLAQDAQQARQLSLHDAMTMALRNGLALEIDRVGVGIAEEEVKGARGIYDLSFIQQLNVSGMTRERVSSFEAENIDQELVSSSLRRLLSTGGFLEFGASLKRTSNDSLIAALDPEYNTGLGSRFTQPLLRGFGKDIVETNITISGLKGEIARSQVKRQAMDLLASVERIYWQLAIAKERSGVARDNLALLQKNLDETKLRREAEVVSDLEVIQARQRVVAAKSDLVDANAAIDALGDQLKKQLVALDWDVPLQLTDSLDALADVQPDLTKGMEEAMKLRPELEALGIKKQINDVSLHAASDGTRPALDLFAEFNLLGRAGTFQPSFIDPAPINQIDDTVIDSVGNAFTFDNFDWAVGATFTYTFGNHSALATVATTKLKERQRALRERDLIDGIRLQLRQALRDFNTAKAQVRSRAAAADLAKAEYEAEDTRLKAGESTTFLVLEALQKLNVARLNLVAAKAQMADALVNYKRATGTSLQTQGISLSFDMKESRH